MHVSAEELLSLALGELAAERAADVAAHAALCEPCGRELGWARAEVRLLRRRATGSRGEAGDGALAGAQSATAAQSAPAAVAAQSADSATAAAPARPASTRALWPGVAARLSKQRPPHRALRLLLGTAAAAAAALAVIVSTPHGGATLAGEDASVSGEAAPETEGDAKAEAALDRAEGAYTTAAQVLEAEYAQSRKNLDPRLVKKWDASLEKARTQLGGARVLAASDVNARVRVLDGYAGYLRSLHEAVSESEEENQ